MDGPHLTRPGPVAKDQAVLFRTWMSGPYGEILQSWGYRMGRVVEATQGLVVVECQGECYRVRPEWLSTHPDMVAETRAFRLKSVLGE